MIPTKTLARAKKLLKKNKARECRYFKLHADHHAVETYEKYDEDGQPDWFELAESQFQGEAKLYALLRPHLAELVEAYDPRPNDPPTPLSRRKCDLKRYSHVGCPNCDPRDESGRSALFSNAANGEQLRSKSGES